MPVAATTQQEVDLTVVHHLNNAIEVHFDRIQLSFTWLSMRTQLLIPGMMSLKESRLIRTISVAIVSLLCTISPAQKLPLSLIFS